MSRATDGPPLTIEDLHRRPTVSIIEAASLLGISADLAYESARRGELPCVSLGRRRLVISARLIELLSLGEKP